MKGGSMTTQPKALRGGRARGRAWPAVRGRDVAASAPLQLGGQRERRVVVVEDEAGLAVAERAVKVKHTRTHPLRGVEREEERRRGEEGHIKFGRGGSPRAGAVLDQHVAQHSYRRGRVPVLVHVSALARVVLDVAA